MSDCQVPEVPNAQLLQELEAAVRNLERVQGELRISRDHNRKLTARLEAGSSSAHDCTTCQVYQKAEERIAELELEVEDADKFLEDVKCIHAKQVAQLESEKITFERMQSEAFDQIGGLELAIKALKKDKDDKIHTLEIALGATYGVANQYIAKYINLKEDMLK